MIFASLEEVQLEAAKFRRELTARKDRAKLVTLSGDLGAGKTSFVQGTAREFGVTGPVTSPTFVLEKIYELPTNSSFFSLLIHIDAYRLEGGEQLVPLDFARYLNIPAALIMLEWPERVADGLPEADVHISLEVLPDNTRSITYTYA